MKKVTAIAPANIAFIKYWGRTDNKLFLPLNPSISMTMDKCLTKTTGFIDSNIKDDLIEIKEFNSNEFIKLDKVNNIKAHDVYNQIERIRNLSDIKGKVHIYTENSFPSDSGIASSASGFCALTACLLNLFERQDLFIDKKEFSKQVRLCGSGSAVRSVYGGFVEFTSGETHEESYAVQLYDENFWDLYDLVCIVDPSKKKVSSSKGHMDSNTSPFMKARQIELSDRIKEVKKALSKKDLPSLGKCIEEEAISMHAVMMTQKPPLFYFEPGTISIIKQLIDLRKEKYILGYFTIDAGANVHVITDRANLTNLQMELEKNPFIKSIIVNKPFKGAFLSEDHLI